MADLYQPQITEPTTRKSKESKRFRWVRRLIIILAALVLVAGAGGAFYVYSITHRIERQDLLPTTTGDSRPPANPNGSMNYVILGSDQKPSFDPAIARSDVVMVLHLDGDRKKAYLISFPRAMYVNIPDHGMDKINHAYTLGGPQLTVRTLESILNTRMDHVVLADFDGFVELTTELGGVTVNNKYASENLGFTFAKGPIQLEGAQALAYVRQRIGLPGGDLARAERQRIVLQAILTKSLSQKTLSNPAKVTRLIGEATTHLVVDKGLTDSSIRKTALSLRMTGDDVTLVQAPLAGHAFTENEARIQPVDPVKFKQLSTDLFADTMSDYVAKYPAS